MAEYRKASFLDDFEMPVITNDTIRQQLVKLGKTHVIKSRKSITSMPLEDRLQAISENVNKILGRYKDFISVIYTDEDLDSYLDLILKKGYLSLDTETNNSLDPLTCKLMGICCYVPNTRPVYIPVNHCKPGTEERLTNQVSDEAVHRFFDTLKASDVKIIYHNGKFDIRVIYNTYGTYLPIWWDTMIGSQLLNENELAKLKYQFKIHVDPTIGTYDIENLFTGLPYAWIDPEVFALYAATDSYDTYKLQQYQLSIFEQPDMQKLYRLFTDIEVPIVLVTASMEDNGLSLDEAFVTRLDAKCKKYLKIYSDILTDILKPYSEEIAYYQSMGQLDDPVNYESNQQLSIIIYNVLKTEPLPDFGKSTEKAALKALDIPFTKALLEYRKYSILIRTFTEPLPKWRSPKDNKIHANFNQMGAEDNNVRTGRFSSKNPNLQQLPSHTKTVRMMFKADDWDKTADCDSSSLYLELGSEIETPNGWKYVDKLNAGDEIYVYESEEVYSKAFIKNISITDSVKLVIQIVESNKRRF